MTCPTSLLAPHTLVPRAVQPADGREGLAAPRRHRHRGPLPVLRRGCGQLIYTKGGKLIDIEGNPESPINEGTLCPKGANAFQLAVNPAPRDPGALPRPLLRSLGDAARSTGRWTRSPRRVKDVARRRLHGPDRLAAASSTRSRSIGTLGGATIDNEENYLIKKLFGGGLGVVSIENQARI